MVALLSGCSLFVEVPVVDGQPQTDTGTAVVINPKTEQKVDAVLDVWCRNLTNVRRITLRFIHVVDPEWQSVCVNRLQTGN